MSMTYGGDQITFNDNSTQNTSATGFGFKNRIINGAMVINQRGSTGGYSVDRFVNYQGAGGSFTYAQSSDAPSGFINSSLLTVNIADSSIAAGDYYVLRQNIEGYNVADLGFGAAGASTITVSFWVKSSIAGLYGGGISNSAESRSYVFTYTINSANTWEYKTATITGDTTGTWLTNNGTGLQLNFDLGSGSNSNGTAGTWAAGSLRRTSGTTNWISTLGATFQVTGVQLEKSSTATSFDYRPYGTELALCQRYYEKSYDISVAPLTNNSNGTYNITGSTNAGGNIVIPIKFAVAKRTAPTLTGISQAGTSGSWQYERSGASALTTANAYWVGENGGNFFGNTGANWVSCNFYGHWTASAEL